MLTKTREPTLTFGVLGDLRMRGQADVELVRKAFATLREQGVAAVVVAGDIVAEDVAGPDRFVPFASAWSDIFHDGCGIVPLVVLGERDIAGGDAAAAWRNAFGEGYMPREVREVDGVRFLLCREPDGAVEDLSGDGRISFIVRHHPLTDDEASGIPPGTVVITGHTCAPLTDPRTIRVCSSCVMVNASSLMHVHKRR